VPTSSIAASMARVLMTVTWTTIYVVTQHCYCSTLVGAGGLQLMTLPAFGTRGKKERESPCAQTPHRVSVW
jgi:hypothetical protein